MIGASGGADRAPERVILNEPPSCWLSSHPSFFIQAEGLRLVEDQLCFSELSSEVQRLQSDRTGPEVEQADGVRRSAAGGARKESGLQTSDAVSQCWKGV